jgi:hypothetical protein
MEQKIRAVIILEILGRPKEHVTESLDGLIKKISEEKGIKIIEKKSHEPKKLEESEEEMTKHGEIFTSFAEVEIEFDKIDDLIKIIFNYMPSSVEIVSPEKISFDNVFLSDMLTGLILKLHRYDEIAKTVLFEREKVMKRLKELEGKEGKEQKGEQKKEQKKE